MAHDLNMKSVESERLVTQGYLARSVKCVVLFMPGISRLFAGKP